MVWVTCGQFFVSFFPYSPGTIVQLFTNIRNVYHLKSSFLLMPLGGTLSCRAGLVCSNSRWTIPLDLRICSSEVAESAVVLFRMAFDGFVAEHGCY